MRRIHKEQDDSDRKGVDLEGARPSFEGFRRHVIRCTDNLRVLLHSQHLRIVRKAKIDDFDAVDLVGLVLLADHLRYSARTIMFSGFKSRCTRPMLLR